MLWVLQIRWEGKLVIYRSLEAKKNVIYRSLEANNLQSIEVYVFLQPEKD